ncbi:MAG: hypothetical protein MJZ47_04945 [Bacteroidales bacterium]|nr:hypothetical protein [Bacteroidales bacterium]
MNNTLDFNRLGKVIRRDAMNFIPNFGWSLVILWAIPVVLWLTSFTFVSQGGELTGRLQMLRFLSTIVLIAAPAKLYKDCNDPRKGIQYAMMPASSLEKFISMFIFCVIVTPIVYMAGAVALDTIMAAFPGKNPYNGFIFKLLFNAKERGREIVEAMGSQSLMYDGYLDDVNNAFSGFFIYFSKIISVILMSSIFMFGNMIFKKRKTSKMIGILTLIFIFAMVIFIKWVMNHEDLMDSIADAELDRDMLIHFIRKANYIIWMISIIISAVMLGLTYRKIKTQKY